MGFEMYRQVLNQYKGFRPDNPIDVDVNAENYYPKKRVYVKNQGSVYYGQSHEDEGNETEVGSDFGDDEYDTQVRIVFSFLIHLFLAFDSPFLCLVVSCLCCLCCVGRRGVCKD